MASITRQSNLFAAEDWNKIYESFREVDLQSYDYQTIRKSMIDYLRNYYPEDFNDFIESSEYVALTDLVAYIAQSLSFRTDLNSRENFLETATRRDSVLRLAKMISYNPKRTQVSRGLIKVTSVSTTEQVIDSNGEDLQGTTVFWGDTNNPDFLEQFTLVMNSAFVSTQRFGKPASSSEIAGVKIEEYNINLIPNTIPVFEFNQTVAGTTMTFEIVKGTYSGQNYLYEVSPRPGNSINTLYRNDGKGFNSSNTGFFFYLKQGQLNVSDFSISDALPNRVVELDVNNIDNNDVYLYSLDSNGNEDMQWSKLPSVSGTNVIYNSLSANTKTVFSVNSKNNDQIELVFGDGVFTDIPTGDFRIYYRVSNGLTYKIEPQEMQNIVISIPYISHSQQLETLTLTLSLENTISNAAARESLLSIKQRSQQQYYTQDRMVTGEDYQIYPFTNFNDIVKSKAVNRTASGISRYLDVRDTTGKYSSTNILAEDGILYRTSATRNFTFDFVTNSDIDNMISRTLLPIVQSIETKQFYYSEFPFYDAPAGTTWNKTTSGVASVTGYFKDNGNNPVSLGIFNNSNLQYVLPGSLLKFLPPTGFVFDINNKLVATGSAGRGKKDYVWASVTGVVGDGINQGLGNLSTGVGPVTLSEDIPSTAILDKIITVFNTTLSQTLRNTIINNVAQYKTFGLRYDTNSQSWTTVSAVNLSNSNVFDLGSAGDTTETNQDASWLFKFSNDGITYTVDYRYLEYVFESVLETRFYFDKTQTVYDTVSAQTVKDTINILPMNSQPDSDSALGQGYNLNVHDRFVETDGFVISEKVKVTFADNDFDNVADDPEFFDKIVAPNVNSTDKIVYYKTYLDEEGYSREQPVAKSNIENQFKTLAEINTVLQGYNAGQVFYASTDKKFYLTSADSTGVKSVAETTEYSTKVGRDSITFRYTHNAPGNYRIDPSPSNIIDLYILTRRYDLDYRNYITDVTGRVSKPAQLTTTELRDLYGSLDNSKSVSDSIIFHNISYRPLFGNKADEELQATFKVVKNQRTFISDNEIKARVVSAINDYFALNNWDFGDTFFFSELSAYLHQQLNPDVLSIIIVPKKSTSVFGSLMQITSSRDEIFISSATVNDVDIISSITANQLVATGNVVSNAVSTISTESIIAGSSSTPVSSSVNTTSSSTTTTSSSSTRSGSTSSGSTSSGRSSSSGGYSY